MTNIYRSLLLVIAGATQKELARQIKYLKVENEILRRRLPSRVLVTMKERAQLVKFACKLAPRRNSLHAAARYYLLLYPFANCLDGRYIQCFLPCRRHVRGK